MSFDTNAPWMGGGLALAVAGYALFSAFITGPELLIREANKAGWQNQCQRIVVTELKQSKPVEEFTPDLDYRDVMRGLFGRDADPFLQMMQPLGDIADKAQAHKRNLKRQQEARLQARAKAAGSSCACAVTAITERRVALGLYAGSGRMITPPLFKDLDAELKTSLRSPRCQINFGN